MHFFPKAPVELQLASASETCAHANGKCADGTRYRVMTSPTMVHLDEIIEQTACETHRAKAIIAVTKRADVRYREVHEDQVLDLRDRIALAKKNRDLRGVLMSFRAKNVLRRETLSLVAAVAGA